MAQTARADRRSPGATAVLPGSAGPPGTRRRILEAALARFAERGYHATSIRDIAAGALVKSASLYSHFPTKEAILAGLVLLGHEELHERLVTALIEGGPDPRDQLSSMVRAHVTAHTEYPLLAVVTGRELANLSADGAAPALALRRRCEAMLAQVVDRGAAQGLFHPCHADATRAAIGTMGSAVASWYPEFRDLIPPEVLAESYATLALRMLDARPTS